MPRPLNLRNMTHPPDAGENPWSDLLWADGGCVAGSFAAHDAIKSLTESDYSLNNPQHVLWTLEETIKALTNYYWALHLMIEHERLHEENGVLAGRIVDGTASPADFVALGKRLEAMNDLKQKVGITNEEYAALLKLAFAPVTERGAA